jgi:hypothetical protein
VSCSTEGVLVIDPLIEAAIDQLGPGEELDHLVATTVMKWFKEGESWCRMEQVEVQMIGQMSPVYIDNAVPRVRVEHFRPSTDPVQNNRVVNALNERLFVVQKTPSIVIVRDDILDNANISLAQVPDLGDPTVNCCAALCRAALKVSWEKRHVSAD